MALKMCSKQYSDLEMPEINLKKCGEIFIALNSIMDDVVYALNCIYCKTICNNLEVFSKHVKENHYAELFPLQFGVKTDKFHLVQLKTMLSPEEKTYIEFDPEESDLKNLDEYDPLDEGTLSVQTINNENDNELDACFNASHDINMSDYENEQDNEEGVNYCNINSHPENDAEMIDLDSKNIPKISDVPLVLAVIQEYKKYELLWDEDHPLSKDKIKQQQALKEITKNVNEQNGRTHNWETILEVIRKIRHRYRVELRKIKIAESEGKSYNPPYFFDGLSFLREIVEDKLETYSIKLAKPRPILNLDSSQILELIKIYQNYPCLWNVEHIGYRFKNKRNEASSEMLRDVQAQISEDITENELRKLIHRIRNAYALESHTKIQCELTQKEYHPKCEYYNEISFLKDHVGPFKCSVCDQVIQSPDMYRIHKSSHDGSMPFSCPICNRGFSNTGSRGVHIRRHTRDFQHECKICGKQCVTSTEVTVHMRIHTGEKPYFCYKCGQSFRTWTYYDSHMRRHEQLRTHKCTICSKAFYENHKLSEHMKTHLNIRDKVCNICGKAFTTTKYLRQHKNIHDEKKKYSCKICGKNFAQYAGLSGHMKSHGTTITGSIIKENNLDKKS